MKCEEVFWNFCEIQWNVNDFFFFGGGDFKNQILKKKNFGKFVN